MTAEGRFKEWLLGIPLVYQAHSLGVLTSEMNRAVVDRYVAPREGMKILDIGCGTARVLEALPDVKYFGLDHNPRYIRAAQQRFPGRGIFKNCDVEEVSRFKERFDRVLLFGVLHHLPDDDVSSVLSDAADLLEAGGRVVIGFDPVFHEQQSRIARLLARADRGRFVRTSDSYLRLIRKSFPSVDWEIRTDVLRIPYSHFFATASDPK
jgi:SAM-dependent methyltransferase